MTTHALQGLTGISLAVSAMKQNVKLAVAASGHWNLERIKTLSDTYHDLLLCAVNHNTFTVKEVLAGQKTNDLLPVTRGERGEEILLTDDAIVVGPLVSCEVVGSGGLQLDREDDDEGVLVEHPCRWRHG